MHIGTFLYNASLTRSSRPHPFSGKTQCNRKYYKLLIIYMKREDQQDATIRCLLLTCLNMFRASLCPSSGEQRPCYCICCVVVVLLDVVGSGCGALRYRMRALLASDNAAPHNRYQPHRAEPEQHTKCSNRAFVLLKMGIMMPETC